MVAPICAMNMDVVAADLVLIRNAVGEDFGEDSGNFLNPSLLRGLLHSPCSIHRGYGSVMVLEAVCRDSYCRANPIAVSLLPGDQA